MSEDKKPNKPEIRPNPPPAKHPSDLGRLNESKGSERNNSVERPITKFQAPSPWPPPKGDSKKKD